MKALFKGIEGRESGCNSVSGAAYCTDEDFHLHISAIALSSLLHLPKQNTQVLWTVR